MKKDIDKLNERLKYIYLLGFVLHPNLEWKNDDIKSMITQSALENWTDSEFDRFTDTAEYLLLR